MKKAAAKGEMTTTIAHDEIDEHLAAFAARKQFVSVAMNMGWQLGLTVIIPVIIGVKLDDHFHTSPSYTLAALMIAAGGAVLVVKNMINQVNREQQEEK